MKKFPYIFGILVCLTIISPVFAQKKGKTPVRNKGRTAVQSVSQPKIEVESWKEFESAGSKLKLIFPKEPTVSESQYVEFGRFEVKSVVFQSFINTDFYMVEVREYPKDVLPERNDLGESYGEWLKRFILFKVKIISEKTVNFGQYKLVEFVYQQTANEVLIHRALVVGQNLYQIIVQFEIKKPDTIEQTLEKNKSKIDKFFLSFELTGNEFTS